MRLNHTFSSRSSSPHSRAQDATNTAGNTKHPMDALPAATLVLLTADASTASHVGASTTVYDLLDEARSARDGALVERDAAVEKASFLNELLLSERTFHAATMDAVRAEAKLEWDALLSELRILETELEYRCLKCVQPTDGARDTRA